MLVLPCGQRFVRFRDFDLLRGVRVRVRVRVRDRVRIRVRVRITVRVS